MTTHTTATLPWAARSMPRLRTERVRDVEAQAARLEDLERLRWRAGVAPVPAGRTTAADTTAQASALADAELFWVTGDMARLALDASTDVPDWDAGQLIAPRGMMLFAEPLPPLPTPPMDAGGGNMWQGTAPVWGLWWYRPGGGATVVEVLTESHHLPAGLRSPGRLSELLTITATRPVCPVDQLTGIHVAPAHRAILALLISASVLMDTPTVADRKPLDAPPWRGTEAWTDRAVRHGDARRSARAAPALRR